MNSERKGNLISRHSRNIILAGSLGLTALASVNLYNELQKPEVRDPDTATSVAEHKQLTDDLYERNSSIVASEEIALLGGLFAGITVVKKRKENRLKANTPSTNL